MSDKTKRWCGNICKSFISKDHFQKLSDLLLSHLNSSVKNFMTNAKEIFTTINQNLCLIFGFSFRLGVLVWEASPLNLLRSWNFWNWWSFWQNAGRRGDSGLLSFCTWASGWARWQDVVRGRACHRLLPHPLPLQYGQHPTRWYYSIFDIRYRGLVDCPFYNQQYCFWLLLGVVVALQCLCLIVPHPTHLPWIMS